MSNQKMKPHEERVIKERDELQIKIDKLMEFLNGNIFRELEDADSILLAFQVEQMKAYLRTLNCRIDRFE